MDQEPNPPTRLSLLRKSLLGIRPTTHFHTRPCFTLLFHCGSSSHHFCCDPALSVFASKCQGVCHAGMAALCDLGDPGWGDPWFRH